MVQFNLLPDVKVKYIKARRQKRRISVISSLVGLTAVGLLGIMMLYVYGIQGAQLSNLNNKISSKNDELLKQNNRVDDINKVLTVQNQLKTLDTLHFDKPVTSRIFTYLEKMVPSGVTVSNITLEVDAAQNISLTGSAENLTQVNQFVDTLKFSVISEEDDSLSSVPVFSSVVLSSFGRDLSGSSYVITMQYDKSIFASDFNSERVVVPNDKVTTRSALGQPIFQTDAEASSSQGDADGE